MQTNLQRDDLQLAIAIGEAGTLVGAARRLGIDHSTAFRRLGALEANLGTRLFERSRTGYLPTAAGEAVIAAARLVDDEIADLERRLAGADLRPSGVLRVTITDSAVELLTPLFAAFGAAHPQISLEVAISNQFFTLTRRDADLAIRPSLDVPQDLVARRIARVATALYAAPAYAASRRRLPLESHAWLAPDDSLSHLASARWLRARVPPERVCYRASALVPLQVAARAGMGIAPLPCYLGARDAALVRLSAPMAEMDSTLWVLMHPDLRRVARIRAFLDFIVPQLDRLRPLLEGRSPRKRLAARTRTPAAG